MDFQSIERKWQNAWEKKKIFEANPIKNKEKFFITSPYPYVNGPYHIGHGRSYAGGDFFARYQRLKAKNVLYPMAFHITGTPVLAVSSAIKSGDKNTIKLYEEYVALHTKDKKKIKQIVKSFTEPINVYKYFSGTMRKDFSALGMSLDWRRDFTTADKIYNKLIEWQYYKFKEKNYLVQASYPITYCLNCQNAVGEDDIKDGDTNPVSVNEFTLLKFKLADKFLVAATLRPETVFGQTNLWVNPDTRYSIIRVGKEKWIASSECMEKLKYQKDNIKLIGSIEGRSIIGQKTLAPGINREIPILPASFCEPDVGTGIVTSVPSDAPYDYIALRDLQNNKEECKKYGLDINFVKGIIPIKIIETRELGDFAAEKIVLQKNISSQKDVDKLEEATQEVYRTGFHTGLMNKNCGKYAGMPVAKAKDMVKAELLRSNLADKLYEASRKALCRDGGKVIVASLKNQWFLDYNAKGWKDIAFRCLKQMKIYPEKYRAFFEGTFNWLDKRPCARRRGMGTELPFEKGWIIESLSDSTIYLVFYTFVHYIKKNKLKPEQLIPEVFDFVLLQKEGVKLVSRKSKIPEKLLKQMRDEFLYWYPVDQRHTAVMHLSNHLSFYIFHHAAIFPEDKWPRTITLIEPLIVEGAKMSKSKGNVIPLAHIQQKYGADLFRLYVLYNAEFDTSVDWREKEIESIRKQLGKIYAIIADNIGKSVKPRQLSNYARALFSKFTKKLREADELASRCELRKYCQIVAYDIPKMSGDYLRLAPKAEQKSVLRSIAGDWLVALSPVTPHLAEELWHKQGNKGFVSLAGWPEFDAKRIDEQAEKFEEAIRKTIEDTNNIIKIVNKVPKKICLYVIPPELGLYKSAEKFYSEEFRCEVKVFAVNDKNKYDPENKALKAKPGKPGIYLE